MTILWFFIILIQNVNFLTEINNFFTLMNPSLLGSYQRWEISTFDLTIFFPGWFPSGRDRDQSWVVNYFWQNRAKQGSLIYFKWSADSLGSKFCRPCQWETHALCHSRPSRSLIDLIQSQSAAGPFWPEGSPQICFPNGLIRMVYAHTREGLLSQTELSIDRWEIWRHTVKR